MFQFPRLSPGRMVSDRVAAHDGGWVPPFGNPGIEGRLRLPRAYRGLPRPSSTSDAKASAVRPWYLAPSGSPPGRKAWSMMVHVICINGIKKEIAFIRHEDAQAFPAACCSVKLLCADVFHDMEIRYSRYLRFESLCGSQGARESREPDAGTEAEVPGGASSGGLWSSGFGLLD